MRYPRGLSGGWAADAQPLVHLLQRKCGVIVELEVGLLFWVADPEVDVGSFQTSKDHLATFQFRSDQLDAGQGVIMSSQSCSPLVARRSACTRRHAAHWD